MDNHDLERNSTLVTFNSALSSSRPTLPQTMTWFEFFQWVELFSLFGLQDIAYWHGGKDAVTQQCPSTRCGCSGRNLMAHILANRMQVTLNKIGTFVESDPAVYFHSKWYDPQVESSPRADTSQVNWDVRKLLGGVLQPRYEPENQMLVLRLVYFHIYKSSMDSNSTRLLCRLTTIRWHVYEHAKHWTVGGALVGVWLREPGRSGSYRGMV
jgi:hypothetical protein